LIAQLLMTRTGLRVAVSLLLLAVATALLTACSRSGKGSLSAVVFVYDENDSPVSEAEVRINASSPALALTKETNSAGTAAFTNLGEDEFKAIAGLSASAPPPEFEAIKDGYFTLSARVSGGDYAQDDLARGGRVHIDIAFVQSEVDDPSWTPRRRFADADLHDILFADSERGWAAGSSGSVFYTADGGSSWISQASGASGTLTGLALDGSSDIWAVAPGTALVRAAPGADWATIPLSDPATIQKMVLSPDGTAWAIGSRGILRSVDRGYTWSLSLDPAGLGLGRIDLTDIAFGGANEGWVTGRAVATGTGIVLHSEDAGADWSKLETPDCPLLAVVAVGPGSAWVTGCDVYRIEQGKLTAVPKMPEVFEYYDVAATGFGEVWVLARTAATGDASQFGPSVNETSLTSVFHTEDGGNTWDVGYRSLEARLNAITVTDDGRGWIVGDDGLLLSLSRTSKQATPTPRPLPTSTPTP
jgi:photosystem II stability/assembly factor-like uncharacterized protein